MTEPKRIVIIGAGLAGAKAAGTLREKGYEGDVVLLGTDRHHPYELPPLSKDLLIGSTDEPAWVYEDGFYAQHRIDLRRATTATRLDLGARTVLDDAGDRHTYDRLLLATGSIPRSVPVPGVGLPGVRTLRRLDDSRELRETLTEGTRVVIIGAGWIGTEVAAAARERGATVTVVDQAQSPLGAVLGDEIAGVFRGLHDEHGVRWRLGTGVQEITGTPEAVHGVRLTSGEELPADVVLLAVGVAPRVDLAHVAGLELADDGGICVDAGLRTAAPDVYAIGDIAAHFHPRYGKRVRVEHWANAKNQGEHVAGNLIGANDPYLRSPYFFTDQYDLGCEYRGLADPDTDELVVRGDLESREFIAFWVREGAVRAAMNVNSWDDGDALDALVDGRATVTAKQLREADLASLT